MQGESVVTQITKIEVLGLRHLRDVLIKQIPAKAQEKVVVAALRQSFKPMVQAAKNAAEKESGALAGSIQLWKVSKRKKRNKSTAFASVEIGPRRSSKKAIARYLLHYGKSSLTPDQLRLGLRYGHLIEYGIPAYGIGARPFLRPAFDSKAGSGVNDFRKEFGRAIDKESRRLAKKQNKRAK